MPTRRHHQSLPARSPDRTRGRARVAPVGAARLAVFGICVTALAGCKLIDQRTFDSRADRAPVAHVRPPPPGPPPLPPLAKIGYQAPEADWKPGLEDIVRQALARKPDALFRVQTLVPATGTPAAQATALSQAGGQGGRPVAEALVEAGASTAQIEMSAMTDQSVTKPEVRVYVR